MDSLLSKAQDRAYTHYRDLESYVELRRSTIGIRPLCDLLLLHKDYPPSILEHPHLMEVERLSLDMIALSQVSDWLSQKIALLLIVRDQDICSYNEQQASHDDTHNIVGIYRHENACSIQEALSCGAERCVEASSQFIAALNDLPPCLESLRWYFDELGFMAIGNHDWSFFAPENRLGPEILKTRVFEVRPKER